MLFIHRESEQKKTNAPRRVLVVGKLKRRENAELLASVGEKWSLIVARGDLGESTLI